MPVNTARKGKMAGPTQNYIAVIKVVGSAAVASTPSTG